MTQRPAGTFDGKVGSEGAFTEPNERGAPRFVEGSIFFHVVRMSIAASMGPVAVFSVDLMSLIYVASLGKAEWTAGIGFSTIVLFSATTIIFGCSVAIMALVSRALGERDRERARQVAGSTVMLTGFVAVATTTLVLPLLDTILSTMGAQGETKEVARGFLSLVLSSNVLFGLGLALSAVVSAAGDAKRSMYVTLSGAAVAALLDPILILLLNWGVTGAAISLVLARLALLATGAWAAIKVHGLLSLPRFGEFRKDCSRMMTIALPVILGNLAVPSANAIFTKIVANFGDSAVAAIAIIDRVIPLAFAGVLTVSGAIGPILGQNLGAKNFDRLPRTLRDALLFLCIYVTIAWIVLLLGHGLLPRIFSISGTTTADLVIFYCLICGPLWLAYGGIAVANAAFNNLGWPLLSPAFNWGNTLLGTLPCAMLGASVGGVKGAMVGLLLGAVIFSLATIGTAFYMTTRSYRG